MPALGLAGYATWLVARVPGPDALERHLVSQKGREFRPGALSVRQGAIVRIANDDEDLSHHAYVASDRFKFDSGDQGPGQDVDITFSQAGTFNVLCGIHPKMRLMVQVNSR